MEARPCDYVNVALSPVGEIGIVDRPAVRADGSQLIARGRNPRRTRADYAENDGGESECAAPRLGCLHELHESASLSESGRWPIAMLQSRRKVAGTGARQQ